MIDALSESLICITGTTGTGKNRIGAILAASLGGSVLSLDSMKVYTGMDIGTAKPGAQLQELCTHHLLDIVDPSNHMDMSRFLQAAEHVLAEERKARRPVVCVGGTAMYLNGLLFGLQDTPPRDEAVRSSLRAERDETSVGALHDRLARVDPESAARIDPNDYQRIERALEILELTGKPAGAFRRNWFGEMRHPACVFVLTWPRELLRERIDRRVDQMFNDGWPDEVAGILGGNGFGETASRALGYPEIIAMLEGKVSEVETRQLIKTRTWQFAKRQLTWYRKFTFATSILLTPESRPEQIAEQIRSQLS